MSGGTVLNRGEKPVRRRERPQTEHGERTLYRRVVTEAGAVRYVACAEIWDRDVVHYGDFLIHAQPGSTSVKRLDEPGADRVTEQRAALVAAAITAEDAMVAAMREASRERPERRPLTALERKGWKAYCDAVGQEGVVRLEVASAREVVDAGIKALIRAVEKTHGA